LHVAHMSPPRSFVVGESRGKADKIEFRGQEIDQRYRISSEEAKIAKRNFADGDIAAIEWELREGARWIVDLRRKEADAARF